MINLNFSILRRLETMILFYDLICFNSFFPLDQNNPFLFN